MFTEQVKLSVSDGDLMIRAQVPGHGGGAEGREQGRHDEAGPGLASDPSSWHRRQIVTGRIDGATDRYEHC